MELPRPAVADYLEQIDPSICARYIVFLIEERGEVSPLFHDRLAELYLSMTLSAKKRGDESAFSSSQNLSLTDSLQNHGEARIQSFCNSSTQPIITALIVCMAYCLPKVILIYPRPCCMLTSSSQICLKLVQSSWVV